MRKSSVFAHSNRKRTPKALSPLARRANIGRRGTPSMSIVTMSEARDRYRCPTKDRVRIPTVRLHRLNPPNGTKGLFTLGPCNLYHPRCHSERSEESKGLLEVTTPIPLSDPRNRGDCRPVRTWLGAWIVDSSFRSASFGMTLGSEWHTERVLFRKSAGKCEHALRAGSPLQGITLGWPRGGRGRGLRAVDTAPRGRGPGPPG